MPSSKVTVKDLARICGVSIGTIDRAINDRPNINPETKRRVLEAAKANGFVKNQNALMLSSGRSNLIGVIIPALDNEFLSTLVTAIEDEAASCDCSAIIMLSHYDRERELECAKRMRAMNIAGLVVFTVLKDAAYYLELASIGVNVIAVGNRVAGLSFVGIDDRAAMRESVRHVISRGWERLVYIAPLLERADRQNINAQSDRLAGFRDVIDETVKSIVIDSYAALDEILPALDPNEQRTALICPTDAYTLKCLPMLERGFGIMGFDRLPTLGALLPRLAGVAYPTAKIGRAAVKGLFEVESDRLFDFEIVPGETV